MQKLIISTLKRLALTTGVFCMLSTTATATGPRVTSSLLTPQGHIIVAIDNPPLYSSQYPNGGLVFELITASLNTQNETAILTTYPIQKMVNYYLSQEKALGAIVMENSLTAKEKKRFIALPVCLAGQRYIYYKPSHPKPISWKGSLSDFSGLRYGAHEEEDASAYTKAGLKVETGRTLAIFEKLKNNTVDIIKESALSAQTMIDTNFAKEKAQFTTIEPNPADLKCLILFNLQNPKAKEAADKFRHGLSQILKNGKYKEIVGRYEGKNELSSARLKEFETLWKKEALPK